MNKVLHLIVLCACISYASWVMAEWRDPTQPSGFLAGQNALRLDQLEVNGIIISPDRRIAIINGIVVKVGDEFGGNKVMDIEANSVQLEGADSKITLFLLNTSVKQPIINQP